MKQPGFYNWVQFPKVAWNIIDLSNESITPAHNILLLNEVMNCLLHVRDGSRMRQIP